MLGIFFVKASQVGAKFALLRLIFCLRQKNKPSVRFLAPPLPKKVTLRLRCTLASVLATLQLATNLFRVTEIPLLHEKSGGFILRLPYRLGFFFCLARCV